MEAKKPAAKAKAAKKEVKKDKEASEIKATKKTAKKSGSYIYKVGRRKTAIAQVRFTKKGEGKITINKKGHTEYLKHPEYLDIILSPLVLVGEDKNHDITVFVRGGGPKAQAQAIRHGITRALVELNEEFKKSLKGVGYLTRDPRKKERKKPGLKRARRAPQWSKR